MYCTKNYIYHENDQSKLLAHRTKTGYLGLFCFPAYIASRSILVYIHEAKKRDLSSYIPWMQVHKTAASYIRLGIWFFLIEFAVYLIVSLVLYMRRDHIYDWYIEHYKETVFASQKKSTGPYFEMHGKDAGVCKTDNRYFQIATQLERCFPNASIYTDLHVCGFKNGQRLQRKIDLMMLLGNTLFLFDSFTQPGTYSGKALSQYFWENEHHGSANNSFRALIDESEALTYALNANGITLVGLDSIQFVAVAEYDTKFNIDMSEKAYGQISKTQLKPIVCSMVTPIELHCVNEDIHTREFPELIRSIVPDYKTVKQRDNVKKLKAFLDSQMPENSKTTGGFGKKYRY